MRHSHATPTRLLTGTLLAREKGHNFLSNKNNIPWGSLQLPFKSMYFRFQPLPQEGDLFNGFYGGRRLTNLPLQDSQKQRRLLPAQSRTSILPYFNHFIYRPIFNLSNRIAMHTKIKSNCSTNNKGGGEFAPAPPLAIGPPGHESCCIRHYAVTKISNK